MVDVKDFKKFLNEEQFYSYFEKNEISFDEAINILVKTDTILSMYVIVQIFGNDSIPLRFNWDEVKKCNEKYFKALKGKNGKLFKVLYPNLLAIKNSGIIGIHKLINIPIKELKFDLFHKEFSEYVSRKISLDALIDRPIFENEKKKNIINKPKEKVVETHIAEKYEYGLSDW